MKKKPIEYVNNKQFHAAIVKYREDVAIAEAAGKELPRIPNYIGECITKIAEKLSTKPCFINYSFRDEMISDGIENCILYFHDYDPNWTAEDGTRGQNAFAYFTQIVYYAFLRRINKEEKNRYALYKNFQETITNNMGRDLLVDSDDNPIAPTQLYDNINDFMGRFERKEEIKKAKRKQAKEGLSRYIKEENNERTK
jgi:hypothetical protein